MDYKFYKGISHLSIQVGSRLIDFLIETAYIQPPANQSDQDPPDIRPAFAHTFRTVSKAAK